MSAVFQYNEEKAVAADSGGGEYITESCVVRGFIEQAKWVEANSGAKVAGLNLGLGEGLNAAHTRPAALQAVATAAFTLSRSVALLTLNLAIFKNLQGLPFIKRLYCDHHHLPYRKSPMRGVRLCAARGLAD